MKLWISLKKKIHKSSHLIKSLDFVSGNRKRRLPEIPILYSEFLIVSKMYLYIFLILNSLILISSTLKIIISNNTSTKDIVYQSYTNEDEDDDDSSDKSNTKDESKV